MSVCMSVCMCTRMWACLCVCAYYVMCLIAVTSYHIGGLGGGIQLHHQSGDAENPLIFPRKSTGIIYSDDHEQTWQNRNHSSGVGGEFQVSKHF